jgi:hypothetical protein
MAWLTGWRYRKSITVSRASGAVTNYQLKLLLGESSGATGESVDCGGHCLSSFNDLRFTASDGATLLDYWIESITGTTPNQLATIWVEFDNIGTDATTFYMYYGNSGASAYSNGHNTFILFEDAEWGNNGDNINGSGGSVTWTSIRGTPVISTEQKYGGSRSIKIPHSKPSTCFSTSLTAGTEYNIRFRYYKENAAENDWLVIHGNASKRIYVQIDPSENVKAYNGSTYVDTTLNALADAWGLMEIYNINWTSGTFDIIVDGSNRTGVSMDTSGWTNILAFCGDYQTVGADHWIDNIIVRNWRSTEPAWGSWGAEEMLPSTISAKLLTPTGWQEVWVGRDGVKTLISGGWF